MAHQANVAWRGRRVCSCIIKIVEMFEARMRTEQGWASTRKLRIFQGCYNAGGVSASAGTHDEGGAIDSEKLNDAGTIIARECGTTSWQRGRPEDPYFDDHNHWIAIGCPDLSSGAKKQVTAYRNGLNGLANNGPDKSPHVPYITWQDALAKYESEGLLGMTEVDRFSGAAPQSIARDGKWKTVKLNEDGGISFLSGPVDLYIVVSNLQISNMAVSEVAQLRYIAVTDYPGDKATVINSTYPIKEITGTDGGTYDQIVWLNNLGKSKDKDGTTKLRLQILAPGELDPVVPLGPIVIEKLVARIAY
jgi:hypothetical protein